MLYTRKGDDGTTKVFDSKPGERISKSSCRTESLGALDELNSFLGLAKIKASSVSWTVDGRPAADIVLWAQKCLFIIQAEVAGADKAIGDGKVTELEKMVDQIESEMPPIKSFFISGGTELAALFDVSRTLARKAERRVIAGIEDKGVKAAPATLAFLNRLSSLFYAMARLSNHKSGIKEESPDYK
jgi:cob(I)alamin adenosyltransferase